jgi:hypothetical integral membrane protein (TIGR02206 family)
LHLAVLAGIAAMATLLALLCRRRSISPRAMRLALSYGLAANEIGWWIYRYSHEGIHVWNLPLQLCDLSVWLAVVAGITLAPMAIELAYFAGLAGAGMALVTPDLYRPWPSYPAIYFFAAHGGIVIIVAAIVFGGVAGLRPGAVWRVFTLLLVYAVLLGGFDAVFHANYMYLCTKPANASLLDALGPWPVYLAAGAVVALALFWLLWIPARPRRSTPPGVEPASSGTHGRRENRA